MRILFGFSGRATPKQFWAVLLFWTIGTLVVFVGGNAVLDLYFPLREKTLFIDNAPVRDYQVRVVDVDLAWLYQILVWARPVWLLALVVSMFAVSVRRLRDRAETRPSTRPRLDEKF